MRLTFDLYKIPHKLYTYTILPRLRKNFTALNTIRKNTDLEKEFIKRLNRYKVRSSAKNKSIILCQSVEDHIMCIKLASASYQLAEQLNSTVAFYSVATKLEDHRYIGKGWIKKLITEMGYRIQDSFYLAFGTKVIFRNIYSYKDKETVQKEFRRIKSSLASKTDVLQVSIDGICIGDLIYDTYLRFRNKPTVDLTDLFLDQIIQEAIHIYFNSNELLEKFQIKALINTYTSYIHHGIIVRLCIKRNIPVYTVGWYYSLLHKVLPEYQSHANNHFLFHKVFSKLDNTERRLASVKSIFEKRFTGQIDDATAYMKESAFSSNKNAELKHIDWSNTVVFLAHCFFDSPHIYRGLLFSDHYEWTRFTLDFFSKTKHVNVVIKQHPNGAKGNDEIFDRLKKEYKFDNIHFIDRKTSQLQIIESKPKAIITAYGTAAAEFAYLGFPVVTTFDNPFTSYDFTYLATSFDEYRNLLQNILTLEPKQKKEEILEYYYMQHFFYMKGRDFDYLSFMKYNGQTYSDDFLKDYLPKMDEAYFKELDSATKDGFDLIEWEEKEGIYDIHNDQQDKKSGKNSSFSIA